MMLYCWNHDRSLQYTQNIPAQTHNDNTKFISISTGNRVVCAIDKHRKLLCWGHNRNSGLINPLEKRVDRENDVDLNMIGALDGDRTGKRMRNQQTDLFNNIDQVSVGGSTICTIDFDYTLHCWKYMNDQGIKIINVPYDMEKDIWYVAVDDNIICTLNENDKLQCFNPNGPDKVCINGSTKYLSISLNNQMVCAVNHQHYIDCWNLNNQRNQELPDKFKGQFLSVNLGHNKLCAIHTDTRMGLITCWDYQNTFRSKQGEDNIAVTLGNEHICLLKDDRKLECQIEELGLFKTIVPMHQMRNTRMVTNSNYITAAIDHAGVLRIWKNLPKQNENSIVTFEGQMNGFASFKKNLLCAVNSLKYLMCQMLDQELEYEFLIRLNVPYEFSQNIKHMQVGYNNVCAINISGNSQCWWQNYDYRINEQYYFKIPKGYKNGVKFLAPGQQFNCGISLQDSIFCWSNENRIYNENDIELQFSNEKAKFLAVDSEQICQINFNDDLNCQSQQNKQVLFTNQAIENGQNSNVISVANLNNIQKVSLNNDIVCTISLTQDLECFKISSDTIQSNIMNKIYYPAKSMKQTDVSVGDTHICAIDMNGKLTCWVGENGADEQHNECCVCQEEVVQSEHKVGFQCGHWVCMLCEVALRNKVCPMCRMPQQVDPIFV